MGASIFFLGGASCSLLKYTNSGCEVDYRIFLSDFFLDDTVDATSNFSSTWKKGSGFEFFRGPFED